MDMVSNFDLLYRILGETRQRRESQRACPTPAARRVASSTPRPAQQSASVPLITTAGTVRIPKLFARRATSGLCISNTVTSQEGHAIRLTSVTVSSQAGHPALKISIVRLVAIVVSLSAVYISFGIQCCKNGAIGNL